MGMTPLLDLDAIEKRAEAATPGPWATMRDWPLSIVPAEQAGLSAGGSVDPEEDRRRFAQAIAVARYDKWASPEFTHRRIDSEQARVDADFIAHARTDVPALVAEVKRLRESVIVKRRVTGTDYDLPIHVDQYIPQLERLFSESQAEVGRLRAALADYAGAEP